MVVVVDCIGVIVVILKGHLYKTYLLTQENRTRAIHDILNSYSYSISHA